MTGSSLYATDEGVPISTNSMISSFMMCPKQADFKYAQRLKPKLKQSRPLERGTWMHALLESHYKGLDWEAEHEGYVKEFSGLFDEEKEELGDLPSECHQLMESYLWHYRDEEWKVHEVEMTLDADLPGDAGIMRIKFDMLVETDTGLWLVDHKTHKRFPDFAYRMGDTQYARYAWVCHKNKIPVAGFIWNYVKTEAIKSPVMLKNGSRLSVKSPQTDFPTMKKFIIENPEHKAVCMPEAKRLLAMRYVPGEPQLSPFFQRSSLDFDKDLIKRVMGTTLKTVRRMHGYDFTKPDLVERNPGLHCKFRCRPFRDLCNTELMGGNSHNIRHQQFREGDPLDYYERTSKQEDEVGG